MSRTNDAEDKGLPVTLLQNISDDQSNTESGKLGRSVGVIVHHVVSVYPIEIQTACAIVRGAPLTGLIWGAVAHLNADHARENVSITKTAAIDLLRRNSREAADADHRFTDKELDQPAPFSQPSEHRSLPSS